MEGMRREKTQGGRGGLQKMQNFHLFDSELMLEQLTKST